MLTIIDLSPKNNRPKIRGIISRYAWRIGRVVWSWPKVGIRYDIEKEILRSGVPFCVLFIWKNSKKAIGIEVKILGKSTRQDVETGLYLVDPK